MTPQELTQEIDTVTSFALTAYPYIPRKSFYRKWVEKHLAREIPACQYPKLRDRLYKFHGVS